MRATNLLAHRLQVMFSFTHPYSQFYLTAEVSLSGEGQRSAIYTHFPALGKSPASFMMTLQELYYKENTHKNGQIHYFLMQIHKI